MDVHARHNINDRRRPNTARRSCWCTVSAAIRTCGVSSSTSLKSEFRLVLIDLVGSGSSDPAAWDATKYSSLSGYAADILDIVDELDLRDVVFVGHSVSAMIGALATIADPCRFAKLVLLTPSPCYIDDAEYRGGFSKADIDELLESLEQNYLGWSRAMAPVIMGTPDRPELAGRVGRDLLPGRPRTRAGVRPRHVPVGQPRRSGPGYRCRPW